MESDKIPFAFTSGWRHAVGLGPCCSMHRHEAIEMVYHRSGSGVTRLETGETLPFAEGACVVYAPGLRHDQAMETPGEDLCVHLSVPKNLARVLGGGFSVQADGRWGNGDWDFLTSGRAPAERSEKLILDLRATAVLLSVVRTYLRPDENTHPRGEVSVRKAEEFIRGHYATIGSIGEVASHAGLSHDRLRHLFRERRGISLVGFLARARAERAKSLLAHSNLPLKQIAAMCGFRDEFYFSAVFKKIAGISPGQFREEGRALLGGDKESAGLIPSAGFGLKRRPESEARACGGIRRGSCRRGA